MLAQLARENFLLCRSLLYRYMLFYPTRLKMMLVYVTHINVIRHLNVYNISDKSMGKVEKKNVSLKFHVKCNCSQSLGKNKKI